MTVPLPAAARSPDWSNRSTTKGQKMSAKQIPIEFIPTSTATEHGDGVLIHWTAQHEPNKRVRMVCASVESTFTTKRMAKYLREDGRL